MPRERLPDRRQCETLDLWHGGQRYHLTVGEYPDARRPAAASAVLVALNKISRISAFLKNAVSENWERIFFHFQKYGAIFFQIGCGGF